MSFTGTFSVEVVEHVDSKMLLKLFQFDLEREFSNSGKCSLTYL